MTLSSADRGTLLDVARRAIGDGLCQGRAGTVDVTGFAATLQAVRASFVTLEIDDTLRGCIGTLEAHRPLVADVAANAWSAAFRDPRFPPLAAIEEDLLDIHVSVLTAPEPFVVRDEADLLARLRPGIDGLVLAEGARRATFLPSVWDQLPDPRDFVGHLKRKAGLPASWWSPTLHLARYQVEAFSAADL